MSDQTDETVNDAGLTKPKKPRTEAQKAATERMRTALESKQVASSKITPEEKKLRLQAIKEQLNGPLKKNMDKVPLTKVEVKKEAIPDPETEEEEDETPPPPVAPRPKKKELAIVSQPKKQPKIVYESASESEEEEVIVVKKKKKKPTKKTIIYESESEEEEPIKPVRKERETKTQQNANSKFKVTPGTAKEAKPANPYYFAD
jgi:hypothetical protein